MAWFKKIMGNEYSADQDPKSAETQTPDQDASVESSEESEEDEGQLAVDVYQDRENVYVKSTIAGVKPEELDISIGANIVTVRGERKQEEEIQEENYIVQECYWGAFSRSVALPVEIDVDKAEADLKDGILTLTLPKASRSKVKKIKVRGEE